jgi:hypothetical protein
MVCVFAPTMIWLIEAPRRFTSQIDTLYSARPARARDLSDRFVLFFLTMIAAGTY